MTPQQIANRMTEVLKRPVSPTRIRDYGDKILNVGRDVDNNYRQFYDEHTALMWKIVILADLNIPLETIKLALVDKDVETLSKLKLEVERIAKEATLIKETL